MRDVCESCRKRKPDFILDDGSQYCAWCMCDLAKEKIKDKSAFKKCPKCGESISLDEFLFHVATEHHLKGKQKEGGE